MGDDFKGRIHCIENWSLGPMSTNDVVTAYHQLIQDITLLADRFSNEDPGDPNPNKLPFAWPNNLFLSPKIPISLYLGISQETRENARQLKGFLETKTILKDYSILREMILLENQLHSFQYNLSLSRSLMEKWLVDCIETEVRMVIIPCTFQYHSGSFLGSRYNVGQRWSEHCATWCYLLAFYGFSHLHFLSPFLSCFISVSQDQLSYVDAWFDDCVNPFPDLLRIDGSPRSLQRCRTRHYTLWRADGQPLQSHEVDILVSWQRRASQENEFTVDVRTGRGRVLGVDFQYRGLEGDQRTLLEQMRDTNQDASSHFFAILDRERNPKHQLRRELFGAPVLNDRELEVISRWQRSPDVPSFSRPYHPSLEFDAHGIPIRMFGKQLQIVAEDIRRVQIVAYKELVFVPPFLREIETRNWHKPFVEQVDARLAAEMEEELRREGELFQEGEEVPSVLQEDEEGEEDIV